MLLTHHRKLDRWLQLGGHSDGESDPRQVALREAQEESGLARFRFLPEASDPLPLDLDVHPIPALRRRARRTCTSTCASCWWRRPDSSCA